MARSSDGSANYLISSTTAPLYLSPGPFTIQVWFKPADLSQSNKYILTVGGNFDIIWEYASDQIEAYAPAFTGTDPRTGSGITLADTNWHHIVYRYTGAAASWDKFLDGTKTQINATITYVITGSDGGFTSIFGTAGSANVAGSIAEVAIWLSALTDGNISSLAAGVRADTIGTPTYYWRILGDADPEPEEMGTGKTMAVNGTLTQVAHPFGSSATVPVIMNQYRQRRS